MLYLNIKINNKVETVGNASTLIEARFLLHEYRLNNYYSNMYISKRSTKNYNN